MWLDILILTLIDATNLALDLELSSASSVTEMDLQLKPDVCIPLFFVHVLQYCMQLVEIQ